MIKNNCNLPLLSFLIVVLCGFNESNAKESIGDPVQIISAVDNEYARSGISGDVGKQLHSFPSACTDDDSVTFEVKRETTIEPIHSFTCKKLREIDTTINLERQSKICQYGAREICPLTCGICQTTSCMDNKSGVFYFEESAEFNFPGDVLKFTCARLNEYPEHLAEICNSGGNELCPVSCNTCPSYFRSEQRPNNLLLANPNIVARSSITDIMSNSNHYHARYTTAVSDITSSEYTCVDSEFGTFTNTRGSGAVDGYNCETLRALNSNNLKEAVCNGNGRPNGNIVCPVTCNTCTSYPSQSPSDYPTSTPTSPPTGIPSESPTKSPTSTPSLVPSESPTGFPTLTPSLSPTDQPSLDPSAIPTLLPSSEPSSTPTVLPTSTPTQSPTVTQSRTPTISSEPSSTPTVLPTDNPSYNPSLAPSSTPSIDFPTIDECFHLYASLNKKGLQCLTKHVIYTFIKCYNAHSLMPTTHPSTTKEIPSTLPSNIPSTIPSTIPSNIPSTLPSFIPSSTPTASPSFSPSSTPTASPSSTPSSIPTASPSADPTLTPSADPTLTPTDSPTVTHSAAPSMVPTTYPSAAPSDYPSVSPSVSMVPTLSPSLAPSNAPTNCENFKELFTYRSIDGVMETIKCKMLSARNGRRINGVKYYELDKRCLDSEVVRNVCRKRCALCTPEIN